MPEEYYIGYQHEESWTSPPDKVLFISSKKGLAEYALKATFPDDNNPNTSKYIKPISKRDFLRKI